MALKLTPPYKILICIVDRKKIGDITKYLDSVEEPVRLSCLADGTRRAGILDVLGVGKIERSVMLGFVRTEKASKILKQLDKILITEDNSFGWAFTTNLTSISSETLEYIKLKQDAVKQLAKAEEAKQATIKMAEAPKPKTEEIKKEAVAVNTEPQEKPQEKKE